MFQIYFENNFTQKLSQTASQNFPDQAMLPKFEAKLFWVKHYPYANTDFEDFQLGKLPQNETGQDVSKYSVGVSPTQIS